MKISFASTWNSKCGVAVYSRNLVAQLERLAEVDVVELDPDAVSSPERLAARLNDADLAHIQHQYPFFGGMAYHRNWLRHVLTRIERPLVMTVHEIDLGVGDSLPIRLYKRWFNRVTFGSPEIDRLIVHSADYRSQLEGLGVQTEYIRVVPEGVPAPMMSAVTQEAAKYHLGLAGRRVVAIFGFVVKRKGHELALAALNDLPRDVALLIAGGAHPGDETGYIDDLRDQIEADGLSDRVVITDYLPPVKIPMVMAAADVVLAPFTAVSNSGSILRAIAYGKPVVAADLPWMRELNEGKSKVSLFQPGDPRALARAVMEILENPGMRGALVSAARSYARSWTIAQAASRTVAIYKELLSE